VEVLIAGRAGWRPVAHHDPTDPPAQAWELQPDERLALVLLGEHYIRRDRFARPRTWRETAVLMTELDAGREWSHRQVERLVRGLRLRLSAAGHHGLVEDDIEAPGDLLKHNLITFFLGSGTIGTADLPLVDEAD